VSRSAGKPFFQFVDAVLHHLMYGIGWNKTTSRNIGLALGKVGFDPFKRGHGRGLHGGYLKRSPAKKL